MKKVLYKIKKQIETLSLDLTDKVLLTEAATGPYIVTPIIGALAGAKVIAFSRDSKYGSASDVFEKNRSVLKEMNLETDIIFTDKIDGSIISTADIITNSGHLRPINKNILQYAKKGCVIPLMYESWEYRESDLDIIYCKEKGITVGATNERHSGINVFSYLGDMAVRQLLDSGVCLYENRFVLICNNQFGPYIAKTLKKVCKGLGVIDLSERKGLYGKEIDWLCEFPEIKIPDSYKDCEAIIFTAYPFDKNWIGYDNSEIPASILLNEFNDPYLIRYAGDIDTAALDKAGIKYFPAEVQSGHMGILPSDIGFDPVIRLQAGGLKAGELMLSGKTEYKGEMLVELL